MKKEDKDALLSLLRTVLTTAATLLAARGVFDSETGNVLVGAVITLATGIWGMVEKYEAEKAAKQREAVALNVGIAVSNADPAITPPVPHEDVQAILKSVPPEMKAAVQ